MIGCFWERLALWDMSFPVCVWGLGHVIGTRQLSHCMILEIRKTANQKAMALADVRVHVECIGSAVLEFYLGRGFVKKTPQ